MHCRTGPGVTAPIRLFRNWAFAICGAVAVASPVIGAPLSAILIVFELTRNYELTTAAMLSVVFANMVSYRLFGRSWFDHQLNERALGFSQGRDRRVSPATSR
ncbi:MAG: hypothetical protein CM1200mP20_01840 [Pseudomonadota bacterium]|nr:MAG: hypothetical protein CM1200mP20_01840 [Pseudomonadota bacterium]